MPGTKGRSGGRRTGAGRHAAPIGAFIIDATPMMADVLGGYVQDPREIEAASDPVLLLKRSTAWARVAKVVSTRRAEVLVGRGAPATGPYAEQIADVRDWLGEHDAIVFLMARSVLVAFNRDGTRAALMDAKPIIPASSSD